MHAQPNGNLTAATELDLSTPPATEMLELGRPECLRLLAATGIGRVAVTVPGWDHPVIRPVNYVFDEPSQCVLLRSGRRLPLNRSDATRARGPQLALLVA
jgi:hypothetical protein